MQPMHYYQKITISLLLITSQLTVSMERTHGSATSHSAIHSFIAGAGAGAIEVSLLGHVLSYVINQCIGTKSRFPMRVSNWGKPGFIPLHPRYIYKGVGVNIASMAPITALQNSGTEIIKQQLRAIKGTALNDTQQIVAPSLAGGITGWLVATPTEYLPNYMQRMATEYKRGLSAWTAAKELLAKYGPLALLRGGTATAIRDGGFTVGYKMLPALLAKLMPSSLNERLRAPSSLLGAGIVTTLITHPAHVTARTMQNNPQLRNSFAAIAHIITKHGVAGLFMGIVPRGTRVTIAIPTLSITEQWIKDQLQ